MQFSTSGSTFLIRLFFGLRRDVILSFCAYAGVKFDQRNLDVLFLYAQSVLR